MTIETAAAITRMLGPCGIVHWRARNDGLLNELLLAGCDAYAIGSGTASHPRWIDHRDVAAIPSLPVAVVEVGSYRDLLPFLDSLLVTAELAHLILLTPPGNTLRKEIDRLFFTNGWRRHPGASHVQDFERASDDALPDLFAYQRIPASAAARWPVEALAPERNLHMDMLRESGARADTHVARYALAATLVRPGDTVLDCACGLGYGSAVIGALSQAGRIMGIDVDPDTVAYAEANYGGPQISFKAGDAARLDHIPDASIDFIVSMETLEHVMDWQAAAKEFARVLKPDGRLIASVPDRWMDESGEDPSPYHHHVFDWERLREGLIEDFVIERRYVQAAPGGFKWQGAARQLRPVPLHEEIEAEWILVVASANPFARADQLKAQFSHPAFGPALAATDAPMLDYARHMDNPWLYRPLIQLGERIADEDVLGRLASWVIDTARPGSADQGAALCVAGYRILEYRDQASAATCVQAITAYHAATDDAEETRANPHIQRWRISTAFLAGRLYELGGDQDGALHWFSRAAELDWRAYSPALTTKTIAAAFHAARLCLARNDEAAALGFFQLGFLTAQDAAGSNSRDFAGAVDAPNPFGLIEMSEVMDMGGQCAVAIATLPLWRRSPGAFWSRIETKRFGIITWNQALETENARLRRQLAHQRHAPMPMTLSA